jgi:predicted nucleotide-binding protein
MKKHIHYCDTKFAPEVILEAWSKFKPHINKDTDVIETYSVKFVGESWDHDNESEFFSDYMKDIREATFSKSIRFGSSYSLSVYFSETCSGVSVTAPDRAMVEDVHQVFQRSQEKARLPKPKKAEKKPVVIFLGHGRDPQWRDLKDHLQDKHGYRIEAYEVGARAGHTIRDILDDMLTKSSFALLVMTGEDIDSNGNLHARENVIHELGLFQGKLGFSKAIILLEDETNEFSNIHGIQQIRFSKINIKETFGEILATLRREFDNRAE